MARSRSGLVAAAALLVAALLISTADSASLTRQSREVGSGSRRWSRLPKCNLGGICGFRVFGVSYDDESSFVQTCQCPWSCEEDYFNLATQVSKFRCKE